MDTFRTPVELGNPANGLAETIDALVGGKTSLAIMPASLLSRLGIEPDGTMHFRTSDGERVELPVGYALFSVQEDTSVARVVFSPEDRYELGTNTLAALSLDADYDTQCLVPAVAWLPSLLFADEPGD